MSQSETTVEIAPHGMHSDELLILGRNGPELITAQAMI
jgi:hypothetical protein